jgi:hypothetical protein
MGRHCGFQKIDNATEFELRNINGLYTDSSFYDFAEAYKDEETKIVVIDSAFSLSL